MGEVGQGEAETRERVDAVGKVEKVPVRSTGERHYLLGPGPAAGIASRASETGVGNGTVGGGSGPDDDRRRINLWVHVL